MICLPHLCGQKITNVVQKNSTTSTKKSISIVQLCKREKNYVCAKCEPTESCSRSKTLTTKFSVGAFPKKLPIFTVNSVFPPDNRAHTESSPFSRLLQQSTVTWIEGYDECVGKERVMSSDLALVRNLVAP